MFKSTLNAYIAIYLMMLTVIINSVTGTAVQVTAHQKHLSTSKTRLKTIRTSVFPAPECTSQLFCTGRLLDIVQKSLIFNDSKTFVDMKARHSVNDTLEHFNSLMVATDEHPTRTEITRFVSEHFEIVNNDNEFENWTLPDFEASPPFLRRICDTDIRQFGADLVAIWPELARRIRIEVSEMPDRYSLIYAKNGFIIPGGRFREFYYWDSYWVVEGLLISGMHRTVRGMLDNFLDMIRQWGFVPNGARIYYLNRSQPPLLTHMVDAYMNATGDTVWLKQSIGLVEKEVQFWMKTKLTTVRIDGVEYTVAQYKVDSPSPRPESYIEDVVTAAHAAHAQQRHEIYRDIKSAAESGWDFSSRWLPEADTTNNITLIRTRQIIPVDLNAFLCRNFYILSRLYALLEDTVKSNFWLEQFNAFRKTLANVLYDAEDGIWYDYDLGTQRLRKQFYASNFAPLWSRCYDPKMADRYGVAAARYFRRLKLDKYPGGVPTSLQDSGEQWDYPNAWAPLQAIIAFGLEATGATEARQIAKQVAQRWIETNMLGYWRTGQMYEKYSVLRPGSSGDGGEYVPQAGFGFTNGVDLQFINYYYTNGCRNSTSKVSQK